MATENNTGTTQSTAETAAPKNCCQSGPNTNAKGPIASPEQMVALASSLAIAITNDKSFREVETIVNFVQILKCSLNGILEQRAINLKKDIEIIIP